MATQNCPRCGSGRVRRGYRPTPIWWKILFRYNLLCDTCNWEFRGFAIPGTVSTKPPRKRKKADRVENEKQNNLGDNDEETSGETNSRAKAV